MRFAFTGRAEFVIFLFAALRIDHWMPDDAGLRVRWLGWNRFRKPNRTPLEIIFFRKYRRKICVAPLHDLGIRAIVSIKLEGRETNIAQAFVSNFQKESHVGFAEFVDGLHRVAHQKQGPTFGRLPTGSQFLNQVDLCRTGVLKLIH